MNKRIILGAAVILGGFIFQVSFSEFIAIAGTSPNLLLLCTVFTAMRKGPVVGEWFGFAWGILSDIASISIFGSQAFMLTLIGYGIGRLQGKINDEKPLAQMGLVLFTSLFYLLGLICLEFLFADSIQRFKVMESLLQPVYTTMISPVFFWFFLQCSYGLKRFSLFR